MTRCFRWIFLGVWLAIAVGPAAQAEATPAPPVPVSSGVLGFFPVNDVFRPLLADLKEQQFFMSMLKFKTPSQTYTAWSVGLGETLALTRWERGAFKAQVGLLAGVLSQFNWSTPSVDLINTDYTFGVAATHRWHSFTGRLQYYHRSAHLGDELLLNTPIPRLNFSYEALEDVLALENALFRIYGGGEYLVSRDPTYLKRWTLHAGAELRGGDSPAYLRPVAGIDVTWKAQHPGYGNMSIKAGVEMGKPALRSRRLRVLAEFYDGYSPYGQFFNQKIKTWGGGVYLGF